MGVSVGGGVSRGRGRQPAPAEPETRVVLAAKSTTDLSLAAGPKLDRETEAVRDLVLVGGYTITKLAIRGIEQVVVFDSAGQRVDFQERLLPFGISGQDIHRALVDSRVGELRLRNIGGGYSYRNLETIAQKLGFDGKTAVSAFEAAVVKVYGSGAAIQAETVKEYPNLVFTPPLSIATDDDRRRVIVCSGDKVLGIEVVDDDGRVLPPAQWRRSYIENAQLPNARGVPAYLSSVGTGGSAKKLGQSGLEIRGGESVFAIQRGGVQQDVFSDAHSAYAVSPAAPETVYWISSSGTEVRSVSAKDLIEGRHEVSRTPLAVDGRVSRLRVDPHGNFLLLAVEQATGGQDIVILELKSLEESARITGTSGTFEVDSVGRVVFVDSQNTLQLATTNFLSFAKGRGGASAEDRMRLLTGAVSSLDDKALAPDGEMVGSKQTVEQAIASAASKIEERFGGQVERVRTETGLERIQQKIERLRESSDFADTPQVFDGIERKVGERLTSIRLRELTKQLDSYEELFAGKLGPDRAAELDQQFAEIRKRRRSVTIEDRALRTSVDNRIAELDARRAATLGSLEGMLSTGLEAKFKLVSELIGEVQTREELRALSGLEPVIAFHNMRFMLKSADANKQWKDRFDGLFKAREEQIRAAERLEVDAEMQRAALCAAEIKELLSGVSEAIAADVADASDLAHWQGRSPVLEGARRRLAAMPETVRAAAGEELSKLLKGKQTELEARRVVSGGAQGAQAKFGSESFPVFQAQPGEVRNLVPSFGGRWVLNDFVRSELDDIARLSRIQLERQQGILILEGEAGAGKNMLFDIFAHFTNREVYTFNANRQTDKADLTYEFEFAPDRGTFRMDSRFIQMLQKPGSIIIIDEINTLPTGLTKMLNSLLDYRRVLNLPDGRRIKVDPSVIIVGTMNPQNYLGVSRLSQEVLDRSRVDYVDYPPQKKGGRFTPYEAEIMAREVPCLRDCSQAEFYAMWDLVVNKDRSNGGDKYLTAARKAVIEKMFIVVSAAARLREAYRAFRSGRNNDSIEFVFSLRSSCDIAAEIESARDVKRLIKDVVLPKVGDLEERDRIEKLIDNV